MSTDQPAAPSGLLTPAAVRRLVDSLGIRPTKVRGQNFVVDPGTIRRIVRAAQVTAEDHVLEVGPGLGSLTLGLLEIGARVTAVEIDHALARALPGTVAAAAPAAVDRLRVLDADALDLTPDHVDAPTTLVANLPYNVAVPVLLHCLQTYASLRTVLVMVQAEVAERLVAPPGSRTYGVPSAKAAWYGTATRAGDVGRAVFWPVPRVDSALVRLVRAVPPSTTADRTAVFDAVDAAFAQRRKTLRAALAGWAGSAAAAEQAIRAAGLDPGARGEQLDIAAFAAIAEHRPDVVVGPPSRRHGRPDRDVPAMPPGTAADEAHA